MLEAVSRANNEDLPRGYLVAPKKVFIIAINVLVYEKLVVK